jgi:enterochelin esterase-like enzyme
MLAASIITGLALFALSPRDCASQDRNTGAPSSRIVDLSLESVHMAWNMSFKVYLPKGYGDDRRYPVWYALNGCSSNERMWIDAGIAASADELIAAGRIEPLIMVFPYTRDSTLEKLERQLKE